MPNLDLLTGMKVIDMASFVAAPVCGKILAEYGADVIRIEALSGSQARHLSLHRRGMSSAYL